MATIGTVCPIGYLVEGRKVFCGACVPHAAFVGGQAVRLFRENIGDYKQSCHTCGKLLVEPKTPAWPELFDRR